MGMPKYRILSIYISMYNIYCIYIYMDKFTDEIIMENREMFIVVSQKLRNLGELCLPYVFTQYVPFMDHLVP